MTYFTHIRAGLISSVLLLTTALASPALANTLPEISPGQIASDVEVKYNPETGAREYIAPSFDPFEEDRSMAGTASLRSVSNATTIDGQSERGGALLDMTFYYNSASNDPYDTRGYTDAVYLSGEFAPVIRRDNRILECNEQVQDVVYYHEDYYRPSIYVNLFRPYRHYAGHYRYDRFWDSGYGRSYGYSRGYRGYGTARRGDRRSDRRRDRRSDRRRSGTTDHLIDRTVDRARRTVTQREERAATGRRMDRTPSARRESREDRRTDRNRRNRVETRRGGRDGFIGGPRRLENNDGDRTRRNDARSTETRTRTASPRRERAPRADRAARTDRSRTADRAVSTDRTPRTERAPRARNNSLAGAAARRAAPRVERAPRAATPRPAPRATAPAPRPERAAPAPRPQRAERSRPARAERAVSRARETKSRNAPRRGSSGKARSLGNAKLKLMGFMPMASAWSRNVVRNVDVQCAREEMLTVHIPQERLDAARFDGLTVLVLDRAGAEVPVYVPANYIEGFRQAVSGRVTPSVSYQEPLPSETVTRGPVYQDPRPYGVESAPCPVGTAKQDDGTCLQGGTVTYGGYPTR